MIGWVETTDANSYLADKFGADGWASLSNTIKQQALMTAYRRLNADTRFSWASPATQNQKDAQVELAWLIYQNNGLPRSQDASARGVKSFTIGKFSETYKDDGRLATKDGNFGYGAIIDDLIRIYYSRPALFTTITRANTEKAEGANLDTLERIPELYDN